MTIVEVSSVPWFIAYMRLHCRGVTPMVTPNELMPCRPAMVEYWGPRSAQGWTFNDQGLPGYELYVKELFCRVLQLPWPISGVLPYHFARGLVVEALGIEVNWADFAYRITRPHQSHSGIPRVLPEFKSLRAPLPAMAIVMPRLHLSRESPLAASIARHLNEMGGSSSQAELPHAATKPVVCPDFPARSPTGEVVKCTWNGEQFVKIEARPTAPEVPSRAHGECTEKVDSGRGLVQLDADAVSALVVLRHNVTDALENERMELQTALFDLGLPIDKIRHSLTEQEERLNSVELKVNDKSRSLDRATERLRRAREVLNAARVEPGAPSAKLGSPKSSVKIAEQLVDTWLENVAIAHTQLETWELKLKRQRERVAKTKAELTAAEEVMIEKRVTIGKSLTQLQSLDSVLANL